MNTKDEQIEVTVEELLGAMEDILGSFKKFKECPQKASEILSAMNSTFADLVKALESDVLKPVPIGQALNNNRRPRDPAEQAVWRASHRPEGGAIGTKRVSC